MDEDNIVATSAIPAWGLLQHPHWWSVRHQSREKKRKMDKVRVYVGERYTLPSGQIMDQIADERKIVEFEAEKLGSITHRHSDGCDGRTQTLYRTTDGRLVVHTARWSECTLREIEEADLEPGHRFAALGREAGFHRPLLLGEALA